jgi:hypothetical protein
MDAPYSTTTNLTPENLTALPSHTYDENGTVQTFDGPGTIPAMASGFPAIPRWLIIAAAVAAAWYFLRKK